MDRRRRSIKCHTNNRQTSNRSSWSKRSPVRTNTRVSGGYSCEGERTCDDAILFLGCRNSKVAISSCNKTFVLRKPCVKEGNSEKTPLIEAEENSADNDSNDDKLVEVGGGVKRRLVYLTRKECKSSNVDIGDAIKFLQKNKKRKTEKKGSSSSVII